MDPNCPYCYGTGSLDMEETHLGVPKTRPCRCLVVADIIRNMEGAWRGLSKAPRLSQPSCLLERTEDDLYLTCTDEALRAHLRQVAVRRGPMWSFKVVSDADLMVAWLSPAVLVGKEILDPDVAEVSSEKATLVDLVQPPGLLVLRLGVKCARNSATPEVLAETLAHRRHQGKPVWVVDQPARRLDPSHLAFSDEVLHGMQSWPHLTLGGESSTPPGRVSTPATERSSSSGPGTLWPAPGPESKAATQRIQLPVPREKRRKY